MRRKLVLLLSLILFLPLSAQAEAPLTNEDVLKMVAAGLGDELVLAKVKEAPAVEFALEVDELLALKRAGVSEKVVEAMLRRKEGSSAQPPESPSDPADPWASVALDPAAGGVKVGIESRGEVKAILVLRGTLDSNGFAGFGATYMNYPGLRASVRTSDRRPSLLVKAPGPLTTGRYFLAKLDPDEDDEVRSLKIAAMKAGLKAVFGGGGRVTLAPDSDWTLPFDAVEESPGVWRVSLKQDLPPGEYGWYVDQGLGPYAAGLFAFGVD
jgi:hypothetical protein